MGDQKLQRALDPLGLGWGPKDARREGVAMKVGDGVAEKKRLRGPRLAWAGLAG